MGSLLRSLRSRLGGDGARQESTAPGKECTTAPAWNELHDASDTSSEDFTLRPKARRKGRGPRSSARAPPALCQVPECREDLPNKIYYQRHKICLYHSNIQAVCLEGKAYRWCQQCGRFHELEEFDNDRKTCRKALEAHNARRRKRTADRAEARRPAPKLGSSTSPNQSCCTEGTAGTAEGRPTHSGMPLKGSAQSAATGSPGQGPAAAMAAAAAAAQGAPADSSTFARARSLQLGLELPPGEPIGASGGLFRTAAGSPMPFSHLGSVHGTMLTDSARTASMALPSAGPSLQALPEGAGTGAGNSSNSTEVQAWGASRARDEGGLPHARSCAKMELDEDVDAGGFNAEAGPELTSRMLDELVNDVGLQELLGWTPENTGPLPLIDTSSWPDLPLPTEDSLLQSLQLQHLPQVQQARQQQGQETGCGGPSQAAAPMLETRSSQNLASKRMVLGGAKASASPFASFSAAELPWGVAASGHQPDAAPAFADAAAAATAAAVATPWGYAGPSQGLPPAAAQLPAAPLPFFPGLQPLPWSSTQPSRGQPPTAAAPLPPSTSAAPLPQPRHSAAEAWQLRGIAAFPGVPTTTLPAPSPPAVNLDQETLVRLSLKLFNVAPEDLPEGVKREVMGLVTADPAFVDAFVRPGCTHLTVHAMLAESEREELNKGGAQRMAQQLLRQGSGEAWAADMLVQLNDEVAVVRGGRLVKVVRTEDTIPNLVAARPGALFSPGWDSFSLGSEGEASMPSSTDSEHSSQTGLPGALHTLLAGNASEGVVTLWGYNLRRSHDMVVCRQRGRVLDLEVIARGRLPAAAAPVASNVGPGPPEWVLVRPLRVRPGLLQFEVQRGGVLSSAVSLAVLPSRAAAVEAQQALHVLEGSPAAGQQFLEGLGIVVEHLPPEGWPGHASPHPRVACLAARLLGTAREQGWRALSALLEKVADGAPAQGPSPQQAPGSRDPSGATSGDKDDGALRLSGDRSAENSVGSSARQAAPVGAADESMEERYLEGSEGGTDEDGVSEGTPPAEGEDDNCELSRRLSKGADISDWVTRQLRSGRLATGLARRAASAPGCLALLAAATGGTLLLRSLLGEVN